MGDRGFEEQRNYLPGYVSAETLAYLGVLPFMDREDMGLPASGNKPRHAGLHNGIEPDPLRDFIPNFLHGVFGQG